MYSKSTLILAAVVISSILFSGCSSKNTKKGGHHKTMHKKAHWGYTGNTGPAHWGDLSKDYHACKAGKSQSPVDISKTSKGKVPALTMHYKPTGLNVKNNGHTLQVDYQPGSTLLVGKDKYKLLQFHFHTPSEHKRYGRHRPMEAHFVHANDKGQLAVVGVFMRLGKKPNPLFAKILKNAPAKTGHNSVKGVMVSGKGLLPRNTRNYYHYSGSLTTPPCSEGVRWFMMKNSVRVTAGQVAAFKKFFPMNSRPVQPLNNRKVLRNK